MRVRRIKLPATHDEWLEGRRKGIGGSDAASILEMGWGSPLTVFLDKMGKSSEEPGNLAMLLGRRLEQTVADLFTEETGKKTRKSGFSFQSEEFPFMLANIDRFIVGEKAFLECKTTTEWNRQKIAFKGEIPESWYCQCMHYMAVLGYEYCYLAVLIGNKDFRWFKIERDEEDVKALIECEADFWKMIESGEFTGDLLGTNLESKALSEAYNDPKESGLIYSSDEYEIRYREADAAFKKASDAKDKAEKALEALKSEVKLLMGDNCTELKSGRAVFTWKSKASTRIDTKELRKRYPDIAKELSKTTTTREFRTKVLKED